MNGKTRHKKPKKNVATKILTESLNLKKMKRRVILLKHRISMNCLGIEFDVRVEHDNKDLINGRLFVQIVYNSVCTKTGISGTWHGRKWYLSEHMTDDEIVKTIYAAFEAAIKHELMEGFKVDDKILFNPHINFEELLKISHKEVARKQDTIIN